MPGPKLDKNPGEKGMNNFQFMSLLAKSMEGVVSKHLTSFTAQNWVHVMFYLLTLLWYLCDED